MTGLQQDLGSFVDIVSQLGLLPQFVPRGLLPVYIMLPWRRCTQTN